MALVLAAGYAAGATDPAPAKLAAAEGECYAGPDLSGLKQAVPGIDLSSGAYLKTGTHSYIEVEFFDQNCFRLKSKTEARLEQLGTAAEEGSEKVVRVIKMDLIDGETGVKLKGLPDDCVVQVSTPAAIAGASGTGFSVGFNKLQNISLAKVFENVVKVTSRDKPNKTVEVNSMQQVEAFPWRDGYITATGHGVLSERLLGAKFIESHREKPEQIKIMATGRADAPAEIKDEEQRCLKAFEDAVADARSSMAGIIIPMHIDENISLADLLKDNPNLSKKVYEIIAASEIVEKRFHPDNSAEVTVKIDLKALSKIIGRDLTAVLATVREISKQQYLKQFDKRAYLTTKRAAEVDGHRRLAEKIYGSVITSDSTLGEIAAADKKITVTVKGVVADAKIVAERYFADGSIALDLAAPGTEIVEELGAVVGDNFLSSPQPVLISDFDQYHMLAK